MVKLVIGAIIPFQKGSKNYSIKDLKYSLNWIKKNISNTNLYDEIIIIDNNFLKNNNIDLEYYKNKFKPNISYYNKSWYSTGWQVWKPLALNLILKNQKDGDILFFHDINIIKYPFYKKNLLLGNDSIIKFLEKEKDKSIFLFYECYKPLYFDIKYESIIKFNLNSNLYRSGIWAGSILLRNNKNSRKFIESWSKNSQTDLISASEYEYCSKFFNPRFVQHAPEQAVLNLCLFNNFEKIKNNILILHTYKRKISFRKLSLFLNKIRDFCKFLIWILKDKFFYLIYLLFGKNKYYGDY